MTSTPTTTSEPPAQPSGAHGRGQSRGAGGLSLQAQALAGAQSIPRREVLEELARRRAGQNLRAFITAFPPAPGYLWPMHVRAMCRELQAATETVEAGQCAYVIINLMQRHSKSDVASRRWSVWHRLRNPSHELILASYNYQMASELSWDARQLAYRVAHLYGLQLAEGRSALASWRWRGHKGAFHATGIGGTIVGRGADVLLIDDYHKNREEAESETVREKRWHSLQSDLLTRLAPAHAVVIVAQRWHEDDIVGRILAKNDPENPAYDEDFPKFRVVRFPAWDDERGWLFTERYSPQWYRAERAFMGDYAWASQAQQNPQPRRGRLLRADLVDYIAVKDLPKDLPWRRGWDLARTEKERTKDDPDFTVGTLAAAVRRDDGFHIYVRDVKRGQWSTLKRDGVIKDCAVSDPQGTPVNVEAGPDSLDAYQYVRDAVEGQAVVRKVRPSRDKVVRAQRMEAPFESGHVHVVRGPWNAAWVSELLAFPGGRHDDQVDSLGVALHRDLLQGKATPAGIARWT